MLLGMEVKHPTPQDLGLAALLITVTAGIGAILARMGLVAEQAVWPTVAATTSGILLSAFGISIAKHGLRALAVVVAVASLFYAIIYL